MSNTAAKLRLAVVEVTDSRSYAPDYHAYTSAMISNAVEVAESRGWDVTRLAAAELGEEALLDATSDADAIVITGGEDIAPQFYGGESGYEGEGKHFETADAAEIALVRRAVTRQTPVLGICRGHQVINVALGGDLVQHVDDSGHRNADLPIEYILVEHPVQLERTSTLALRLGEFVAAQSGHHQVVNRLGDGLVAAGWSHDGHIEAIEHETLPITGVQWHPEAPASPKEQLERLLDGLDREARREVAAA